MCRATRLLLLSCLLLAFAAAPASAQTGLATLTGLVSDNSGPSVPGVTVTATNQAPPADVSRHAIVRLDEPSRPCNIPSPLFRPDRSRDRHRPRHGQQRRRRAWRHRHRDQSGHQRRLHRRQQRRRRLRHHRRAHRHLRRPQRAHGFKTVQSNVSLSAGQTARVDFKLEVGAVEERIEVVADRRRAADRERRRRPDAAARAGREAADPGPQPGHRDALRRRRHDAESGLVQRPQEHRRRPSLRQRPARAGQQLHARRRRHERRHRQPDRRTSPARTPSNRSASRPTTTRPSSATSPAPSSTW